jgi:probable phosphoglycerate mutase
VSSETLLLLVRHGETSANIDGVWHGSVDTPLTERGTRQAARVADHIAKAFPHAAAIYTSDLQRAHHTAGAIGTALALSVRVDVGLREYDLGSWEGKTFAALHSEHDFWAHIKRDPHYAPHGGESPAAVTERLTQSLRAIATGHAGEAVVVVTHGGALSMALGQLIDGSYTRWHNVMDNCAVSELVLEPAPQLRRFNFTEHLRGL